MAEIAKQPKPIPRHWILDWYGRYERPLSSISLVAGFAFDSLTLTRADQLRENFWIILHLLAVAGCILLIHREHGEPGEAPANVRKHFWLTNVLQFLFGGLLSTYIVFYFRSATLAASWPFMLILVAAFIANDRLKQHRERLAFQVGLFFLSVFALAIFILPVILHTIGPHVFIASGLLSLGAIWGFLAVLRVQSKSRFRRDRTSLLATIAVIYLSVNAMYLLNLIPPLPLSLKDGEVVHGVVKRGANYIVDRESAAGLLSYFDIFTDFHDPPGEPVYAWSEVFSPPALNLTIVHEWQFYDDKTGRWATRDRIPLRVIGGRGGGFRTYSTISSPAPGSWRVNIKTENGAVIGRIRFRVIPVSSPVPVSAENRT